MIPQVLISSDQEEIDKYIQKTISHYKYPPHTVHKIEPLKKELSIEQIREVQQEVSIASTERLFVLFQFHTASAEAQNAFLKTLEEKTERNFFILVVNSENSVLPTIRSRTKMIKLSSTSTLHEDSIDVSLFMKQVPEKDIAQLLSDPVVMGMTFEKAPPFLDAVLLYIRDSKYNWPKKVEILKKILEVKRLIITNNINPQLGVDTVLLFIKKSLT